MNSLLTAPVYKSRTCRRCKGTGQHSNYGGYTGCFDCKATGVEQVESGRRPMTAAEIAELVDYLHGVAHAENRAFDRATRRKDRS